MAEQISPEQSSSKDSIEKDAEPIHVETEEERLGSRPPLQTIGYLSIGPLISQIVYSLFGIVDSAWVSKAIGTDGLTTLSVSLILDFINTAFAQFFCVVSSARLSYLFGCQQSHKNPQVMVDIIRFAVIVGALLPAIFLPVAKPIVRWFGANDAISAKSVEYLIPQLGFCFVNFVYQSLCGLLQAEGRSILFGCCQLCTCILNGGCFDPLFLFAFKGGMWSPSTASVLAAAVPMIGLFIALFMGKFATKPTFKMFLKKPLPDSYSAVVVALSALIANMATSIPVLLLQKFLALSSKRKGNYDSVMPAWNANDRLYQFVICVCNALNQALLPAASFAFGSQRLHRLLRLSWNVWWIGTAWCAVASCFIIGLAPHVAKIWSSDPKFVETSSSMMRISFITCFTLITKFVVIAMLQSMKKVCLAVTISVSTILIPLPAISCILYFTDDSNPVRLLYSFVGNDCVSFVIVIIVFLLKLRFLLKAKDESDDQLSDNEEKMEEIEEISPPSSVPALVEA